jgi:hypothetical protein
VVDQFEIVGDAYAVPVICGENTGQHGKIVYQRVLRYMLLNVMMSFVFIILSPLFPSPSPPPPFSLFLFQVRTQNLSLRGGALMLYIIYVFMFHFKNYVIKIML